MNNKTSYWLTAFIIGTLINSALFLVLPRLGYSKAPPPAPVIKLDFVAWQAPTKPEKKPQKKIPPPKPKPKPRPKPKPPEPKPEPPMQHKEPVLTEKILEQPVEEIIEEVIEEPPEEVLPIPAPIFEVTNLPRFAHRVDPVYPSSMLAQNKQATVKVEALVDSKGVVRQVRILKSGGELFDEAARAAVMASSFVPGDINGKPVAVLLRIPIRFKLQ